MSKCFRAIGCPSTFVDRWNSFNGTACSLIISGTILACIAIYLLVSDVTRSKLVMLSGILLGCAGVLVACLGLVLIYMKNHPQPPFQTRRRYYFNGNEVLADDRIPGRIQNWYARDLGDPTSTQSISNNVFDATSRRSDSSVTLTSVSSRTLTDSLVNVADAELIS